MLAGAEAASRRPATTADKLAAMHAAWFGTYADTIRRSPHAADLLDAKHRLSADLAADAASRYKRLIGDMITEAAAGELDLEPAGLTPDTAAELLIAAASGLESSTSSPVADRPPRPPSPGTESRRALKVAGQMHPLAARRPTRPEFQRGG
jgi:hypothetical protein